MTPYADTYDMVRLTMRRPELALIGLIIATALGCSNDGATGTPSTSSGSGGQPASNQGGIGANGGMQALGGQSGAGAVSSAGATNGGAASTAGAASTGGVPSGWTCNYSTYGDGQCDCGCGAPDEDCATADLEDCEVCNRFGSCNLADCPGHIDPDDVTKCLPAPDGWTCTPSLYGDGKACDCGCGIQDEDCASSDAASCDNCQAMGSCANGACPSSVVADDNARCEIPARWTCDPTTYGNGTCNCGCGVVDVDCPNATAASCEECDESSCWPLHCDEVVPDDNAHCTNPPPAWNCSARLYHDGSRCDCGCGAIDPDCDAPAVAACDKCDAPGSCSAQPCPGIISTESNGRCDQPEPPAAWTCPANAYADGIECDCGCGVPDLDCRSGDSSSCARCLVCGGHGDCRDTVDADDPTQCAPPPSDWTCSAEAWRDAICDCGCGRLDSYCQNIELSYVCGNYPVEGCSGGNRTHIDPSHNERCLVNVPREWSCDRGYYADGLCDCGCGAVDPDCASNEVADCEQCDDAGSCSPEACPGSIAEGDTGHCSN